MMSYQPVRYRRLIRMMILSIVVPVTLFAAAPADPGTEDTSTCQRYWVNAGFGASSYGGAGGAGFSYLFGSTALTVRAVYTEEFNILGPKPANAVWDIGLMAGFHSEHSTGYISGSAGLSLVSGTRRGEFLGSSGWFSSEYKTSRFTTVGIPAEVQLFWRPLGFFGIGITAFADLNPEQSFAGGLLMLQFGELR